MNDVLVVRDRGRTLMFTFEDINRYHGGHSPAGVAIAFKAMELGFSVVCTGDPPERRSVVVRTAFRGPGARDAFEAVTRGVTDDRYVLDRSLVRSDRGRLLEDFVFVIEHTGSTATLLLRAGFVTDEFIDLARAGNRTQSQEDRLDHLKAQLAQQVMAEPAREVFELG
ncbi:hypothetical protein [Mycobacterium sp. 1164985.4]|uniref:hypothetical protein n=1 Tax=Mycobacterium sp. 1164985.4 TaxID=1834069 RepID=UPI000801649A|nr:hypothetical protein [Mycobacterium sp. 1164985.4]OBK72531.1 hypothetical protein A5650_22945 [Mycobacterium sp. 1164985.4]